MWGTIFHIKFNNLILTRKRRIFCCFRIGSNLEAGCSVIELKSNLWIKFAIAVSRAALTAASFHYAGFDDGPPGADIKAVKALPSQIWLSQPQRPNASCIKTAIQPFLDASE